jgi:organic hydroperoxide reductase OsmC/OhrA
VATISWDRAGQDFLSNQYSRKHTISFDGGIEIAGSSSPHVVPVPMSDPAAVDPEEAFVASLSSCHMLWFLAIAAKQGFVVDSYLDNASGVMARNSERKMMMTVVTLSPVVSFGGTRTPTEEEHEQMHHQAHDECFIANSVITEVRCNPRFA